MTRQMIRSVFSILPSSPVDPSQDVAVLELQRARTAAGNLPQEAGTAHLRGFHHDQDRHQELNCLCNAAGRACLPATAVSREERSWQHLQAPSPWLRQHTLTARSGQEFVDSQAPPCSGEGCCRWRKRKAAEHQAKSCPQDLTQEIITAKWFCTPRSGAVQAPAHRMMEIEVVISFWRWNQCRRLQPTYSGARMLHLRAEKLPGSTGYTAPHKTLPGTSV